MKKLFETTDVFVFTLGLTECWNNTHAGHTYPVCPGTARGEHDAQLHRFRNLTYPEVMADLDALIQGLQKVNPDLKVILTVSPVPLVATNTDQNVLIASSYSKSVLRAVCGEIESRYHHVQYFPSFEIVGHVASFGQYLASDLREVAERGVAHVMSSFFSTFFAPEPDASIPASIPASHSDSDPVPPRALARSATAAHDATADLLNRECEEMFNDVAR